MSKNNIKFLTLKKDGISDFAYERNRLVDKAKAEWIFFLDSDEKIPSVLKKEILVSIQDGRFNGYYVPRENYFLYSFVGTDNIIRLGKKECGKWERKVHEVWKIKGNIGQLKYPIIHNTSDNLRDYITKINSYSLLHANENISEGKRSSILKIIFYPLAKFIITYKKSKNIVFSIMQSFHSFLSWSEMWLQNA